MTGNIGFPAGRAVALDDRVRVWKDASVLLGGAPWGVLRIAPRGRDFVRRLADAGACGVVTAPGVELAVVNLLLARGIVHPVPVTDLGASLDTQVDVVVPAYERPELLRACLASLRAASPAARIIVVDDASTDDAVAEEALATGAVLVRHPVNRGPA
ncbi:MAG: glycosyltransferase, partial [Mycobacteriaceae bacterium]